MRTYLIVCVLASLFLPASALRAQGIPESTPARGGISRVVPGTQPAEGTPPTRAARGRGGLMTRGGPPSATDGPTCTIDAIIYDVRVPADQIGKLDLAGLARAAANADDFEKVLAELGATQPLYRANQSVRLFGDSITIGTNTPYIASSTVSARGQVINTPAYASVGALFRIVGKPVATGMELDMNIEVSALTESKTEIGNAVMAPLFRTTTMSHKGVVQARQPFLVVSVDAATPDPAGKAVAYIARITLGEPQTGSPPARGE